MSEEPKTKGGISVISVLVAVIYGLAGIIAGLATHNFKVLFEGIHHDRALPGLTRILFDVPVAGWVIGSILIGGIATLTIERTNRARGEVPRWMILGLVLAALVVLILIMSTIAWPLFGGAE